MPPGIRNLCPLTDPIHLPSSRRMETSVVNFGSPTGTYPSPTLMTLVSTMVVWIYGGLTVQALNVIAKVGSAGAGIESGHLQGLAHILLPLGSINVRAERAPGPCSWSWFPAHPMGRISLSRGLDSLKPHLQGKPQPVVSRVWPSVPSLGCGSLVDDDKMNGDQESQTFQVLST